MDKQYKSRGFPPKASRQILLRDNFTCVYCGDLASEVDHVVPFIKGGKTIKSNGVACCRRCNRKKKGFLIEEFLVKGLMHLAKVGEDISWVDTLYTKKLKEPTEIEIHYIEKMLQDGLEPSEISQLLGIDINTIEDIMASSSSTAAPKPWPGKRAALTLHQWLQSP